MRSLFRISLATAGIVLGVHAVASAQQPDSVFVVRHENKRLLRLNSDGGFLLQGEDGVGGIPATGGGVRMMWYPAKGAFRAGVLSPSCCGAYWDDANIGFGSVALGVNVRASGRASIAAGDSAAATGPGAVALGVGALASGDTSFAVHGWAEGRASTAIGVETHAQGIYTVALGRGSVSIGDASVAIGAASSGPGAFADGFNTVALGAGSRATGVHSVAIGSGASTNWKIGSIVISDHCSELPGDSVYATNNNQFVVRACGGYRLYTDEGSTTGVQVAPGGGSWSSVSDVNRKENFEELDGEEVLARLREVPVMTWNYKSQDPSIRHAGPTAQDFHAAFGLGESELLIATVDIDGISLAAVKALEARTTAQQERIEALEAELAAQRRRIEELEQRVERLERRRAGAAGLDSKSKQ